jgi:2-oxoglutarate ferredoxin oxidoreductase subunit gamma
MPDYDVIIAGFGGQGVLTAGKLLAWAGMLEGRHVTWFPSYGAEMRGGTANCTVIISEREIGSPVIDTPSAIVAMNQASADKFAGRIPRGGLVIVNSSLAKTPKVRPGVRVYEVPANEIAEGLGETRAVNIVLIGAYLGATGAVRADSLGRALEESLPARHKKTLPVNLEALRRGYELVRG